MMRPASGISALAVVCVLTLALGCRATGRSAVSDAWTLPDAATDQSTDGVPSIDAAAWAHGRDGELGCSCEADPGRAGKFALVRFHERAAALVRVRLHADLTLTACVLAKFEPDNCAFAY
jgi:hypothetical protein